MSAIMFAKIVCFVAGPSTILLMLLLIGQALFGRGEVEKGATARS